MADNAPNFDAMTPEEIMAWMESLAKRQGADSSGFTTAANIDIPEIDPTTVVIDEPGYVPSEGKDRGKKIGPGVPVNKPATPAAAATPPPAPAPVAKPAVPAQPAAKVPPPVAQPPAAKAPPPAHVQSSIFSEPESAIEAPDWLANLGVGNELPPEPIEAEPEPAPASLSWLESLAVDSGSSLPEFDLSSLGKELETSTPEPAKADTNPVNWLESLAQNQEDIIPAAPAAAASNPVNWLESLAQEQGVQETPAPAAASNDDAVNWLESLAKRQGARSEELTTEADSSLPPMVVPPAATTEKTGYSSYTFDSPVPPPKSEPPKQQAPFAAETPADPSAWLDSLATQAFETSKPQAAPPPPATEMSDSDIQQALKKGELVPQDQMEAWMQRQLREGASRPEPEELSGDYDPDAPPVKADLPDWLIEQVGDTMPFEEPAPAVPVAQTPALIDTILEPPSVMDIPDWLKDDEPESDELDSIFATPAPESWSDTVGFTSAPPAETPIYEPKVASSGIIDPTDPWVEALEMEYMQAHGDAKGLTEHVPPTPAAPPAQPPAASTPIISTTTTLQQASLPPETEVPAGQPDAVPDWLAGVTGEEAAVVAAEPASAAGQEPMPDWLTMEITEPETAASGVPDWLADVDVEPADIPDWLKQTITSTKDDMVVTPAAPAAITPASPPPPTPAIVPVRASPAPVPVAAQNIDVAATLRDARAHATSNNLDASLPHYERLIRANAVLDDVVDDLTKLVDKFKTNPAVHRVLGDTLMRQGKLQAALDTYRKALNQL